MNAKELEKEALLDPEEVEEGEVPLTLRIVGRTFWMAASLYCFHKICSYDLYRPRLWPLAKWCYIILLVLAVGSSLYLRIRVGSSVPRYRWRMYMPVPIYAMTFLHVGSFVLMLLTFGITFKNIMLMAGVNTGLLSFLSFL